MLHRDAAGEGHRHLDGLGLRVRGALGPGVRERRGVEPGPHFCDPGIEQPLDAKEKKALLDKAGAFDQAYESAKEWERGNQATRAKRPLASAGN